jgi:carbon monoxide dehydrogenase subunit G
MIRARAEVDVLRPAAEVASFLADPVNDARWQKGILKVDLVEGTRGAVGATYDRVQEAMGRPVKTVHELTANSPDRVSFHSKGKVIDLRLTYALTVNGGGTRVAAEVEGEMLGFAAMFEGMVNEALQKDLARNLERLRETLGSVT